MAREPTTLNTWAIALGRALEERGVDVPALLAEAGLGPAVLEDPNGRHAVSATARLWQLAVARTGEPCLGLHASRYVQPTTFVSLGLAILASDTLEDAMRRGARFSRLVTDAVELVITETPEGLLQTLHLHEGVTLVPQSVDLYMAASLKMGRLLTGGELPGTRLWLRHVPALDSLAEYRAFFGPEITFGADSDAFLVPHPLASQPLPMANPALALASDGAVRAYLQRFDGTRVADRVREAVIAKLSSGEPQRAGIAKQLHLGDKTLQRRLAEEGTTFQALVDETRAELGRRYVADASIPLAEVAFRLGFAEQSGFTRAFKRWTSETPTEFRARPRVRRR